MSNTTMRKGIPIICAECNDAAIRGKYLYCEKVNRTIYNAKPKWCPLPNLFVIDDEQNN